MTRSKRLAPGAATSCAVLRHRCDSDPGCDSVHVVIRVANPDGSAAALIECVVPRGCRMPNDRGAAALQCVAAVLLGWGDELPIEGAPDERAGGPPLTLSAEQLRELSDPRAARASKVREVGPMTHFVWHDTSLDSGVSSAGIVAGPFASAEDAEEAAILARAEWAREVEARRGDAPRCVFTVHPDELSADAQ